MPRIAIGGLSHNSIGVLLKRGDEALLARDGYCLDGILPELQCNLSSSIRLADEVWTDSGGHP